MTLTQQDRARTLGLIAPRRPDWDHAGIEAAITKTSQQHPNDDLLVVALAVAAARDPKALTPAAMHTRTTDGPVVPAVTPRPTPRPTDPECPVCCSQLRDDQGRCVGCRQDAARPTVPRPAPAPYRTTVPAPADFRERVAAAANRTVVGANVPNRNQEATNE